MTKKSRRKDRRKHQKMWTLPEVLKLVEGISEYGVGRWTDIKKFLFSSSSYRTPIDLRVLHKALLLLFYVLPNLFSKSKFCRTSGETF